MIFEMVETQIKNTFATIDEADILRTIDYLEGKTVTAN